MIKSKKSLGQNFLFDKNIAKKIVNLLDIKNKLIIEIGPGLGVLTKYIIEKKPKKLILIEKDYILYQKLLSEYSRYSQIEIYNYDALKFNYTIYKNINLISNLPYNISSKFITNTIYLNKYFNNLVFMVQKELAEKFDYNKNKINKFKFLTKLFSKYDIKFNVSPNVFKPKPKVMSSVILIKLNKKTIDRDKMQKFLNQIFRNKRKKISNKLNINNKYLYKYKNMRIEDLNYKDIIKLYKSF